MTDKKTSITGYIQAVVAILSAIGIAVSPEMSNAFTTVAIAIFGILSGVKGHFSKDK